MRLTKERHASRPISLCNGSEKSDTKSTAVLIIVGEHEHKYTVWILLWAIYHPSIIPVEDHLEFKVSLPTKL